MEDLKQQLDDEQRQRRRIGDRRSFVFVGRFSKRTSAQSDNASWRKAIWRRQRKCSPKRRRTFKRCSKRRPRRTPLRWPSRKRAPTRRKRCVGCCRYRCSVDGDDRSALSTANERRSSTLSMQCRRSRTARRNDSNSKSVGDGASVSLLITLSSVARRGQGGAASGGGDGAGRRRGGGEGGGRCQEESV